MYKIRFVHIKYIKIDDIPNAKVVSSMLRVE